MHALVVWDFSHELNSNLIWRRTTHRQDMDLFDPTQGYSQSPKIGWFQTLQMTIAMLRARTQPLAKDLTTGPCSLKAVLKVATSVVLSKHMSSSDSVCGFDLMWVGGQVGVPGTRLVTGSRMHKRCVIVFVWFKTHRKRGSFGFQVYCKYSAIPSRTGNAALRAVSVEFQSRRRLPVPPFMSHPKQGWFKVPFGNLT